MKQRIIFGDEQALKAYIKPEPYCNCGHSKDSHRNVGCIGHIANGVKHVPCECRRYVAYDPDGEEE